MAALWASCLLDPARSVNVAAGFWKCLKRQPPPVYYARMKFFGAIVAYLFIGFVLGLAIYEAVRGHLWFLAVAVIVYVVAFAKIGCLPSSKSH